MMGSNRMPGGCYRPGWRVPTNPVVTFASRNLGARGWPDVSHDTQENQRDRPTGRSFPFGKTILQPFVVESFLVESQ
jgi:hypothetical protein